MASEIIHRIEQKLLGYELIYNKSGEKDVEGSEMASGMLRLPKENLGDEDEIKNNIELQTFKREQSSTPSSEWIESAQLSVEDQVYFLFNLLSLKH